MRADSACRPLECTGLMDPLDEINSTWRLYPLCYWY